jgi:hypothetical protein
MGHLTPVSVYSAARVLRVASVRSVYTCRSLGASTIGSCVDPGALDDDAEV